jgi:hypothetical protein
MFKVSNKMLLYITERVVYLEHTNYILLFKKTANIKRQKIKFIKKVL